MRTTTFSWFALYSGLLLSLSAFSIDILLPALLSIGDGLGVSVQQIQMLIPVYMLALGLANPVYGWLSDRAGRKPALYTGLGIYLFGSVICVLAGSIEVMLAGRFLQGFGAASAPVVCRAMIRDRFDGIELAQNMAIASMFFALGPLVAPLLGYFIFSGYGWRAVFIALILVGASMLVATIFQAETHTLKARQRNANRSLYDDTRAVFQNPQSLHFIVLSCFCTAMILTFLSHAPIIYTSLGAGPGRFAAMFAFCSIGIVVGQLVNHRLISVVGPSRAAMYAAVIIALTAFAILFCVYANVLTEYVFTALMFAFNTCYLIVYSNFASLVLEPHRQRAGTAAAMFGFASYTIGSVLAALISFITDAEIFRWAVCFFILALTIAVSAACWKGGERCCSD